MSIWHDAEEQTQPKATSVDVAFRIQCKQLAVDHAEALSNALITQAPWIADIPNIGIHSIYVAGSQNGWERPDASIGEKLILSKRTRLKIRTPEQYATRLANALSEQQLLIGEDPLNITSANVKALDASATLFTRGCCFGDIDGEELDETRFTKKVIDACENLGFTPNKILCGKSLSIQTADGPIHCRSVMIADIPMRISLALQDAGLGQWRKLGCGILLPHKDTAAVN